jgi:prevent-host-death family protein
MSKIYSVAAARARLPQILDEVESGKDVQLSRRGRLVAVVVSGERYESLRSDRAQFGDSYRSFVQRHSLAEIGLDTDFFDSARDKGAGRQVRL